MLCFWFVLSLYGLVLLMQSCFVLSCATRVSADVEQRQCRRREILDGKRRVAGSGLPWPTPRREYGMDDLDGAPLQHPSRRSYLSLSLAAEVHLWLGFSCKIGLLHSRANALDDGRTSLRATMTSLREELSCAIFFDICFEPRTMLSRDPVHGDGGRHQAGRNHPAVAASHPYSLPPFPSHSHPDPDRASSVPLFAREVKLLHVNLLAAEGRGDSMAGEVSLLLGFDLLASRRWPSVTACDSGTASPYPTP